MESGEAPLDEFEELAKADLFDGSWNLPLPLEVAREVVAAPRDTVLEREASKAIGLDRVVADGWTPHEGENRRARRAAVANWVPPKEPEPTTPLALSMGERPRMPTRRELLAQRQRRARGTLDVTLRKLQRRKLEKKKR